MPSPDDPYRLPRRLVPSRYSIELAPDLDAARFDGAVTIEVDVVEETDQVVLNAAEIEIDRAVVTGAAGTVEVAGIRYESTTERVAVELAADLPVGPARIELTFRGILNDKLRGFYRSTWTDEAGEEHVLATTQFESTNARRAFPCFDEPDLKAVFDVALVVKDGLTAVSCGPQTGTESLGDGRTRVTFGRTMLLSTYLLAFIVGELETTDTIDVSGVPMRVVHVPGKGDLTAFALDCATFALRFLQDYYDIPYPSEKVDLVAVPDFAFGAMENLGCVTFRENLLLVDPDTATQSELTRIADVISHELAHMWFGDLVTMRWWDGIWLKEAFATFMEITTVDAWQPDWHRWEQFSLERSTALDTDALSTTRPIEFPVISPEDAEGMYDVLTYEKGAAVLRMWEQYLGPEEFRAGIRHYLRRHSYGNVENADLWAALEDVTQVPVQSAMLSWITQGGYPLIDVARAPAGLAVSQRRFRYLPDDDEPTTWSVPLLTRSSVAGSTRTDRLLLVDDDGVVDTGGQPKWSVVNTGGNGFYRVRYSADLRGELVAMAQEVLDPVERHSLVDDTWAAVVTGTEPAATFLDLAEGFRFESELGVWRALAAGLRVLDRIVEGEARIALEARVADLATGALAIVGLEPADGEPPLTRELRGLLFGLAGALGGDERTIERARELHRRTMQGESVEPDLLSAAIQVIAAHGGPEDHDTFVKRFRTASTPQDEMRYLYALAGFRSEDLMSRTLDFVTTGEVRTQNAPHVLASAIANRDCGEQAWRFVRQHWAELLERFPPNSIIRMVSGIRTLSRPEVAADVDAFFAEHSVPMGQLSLRQHLEKLRVNVALRAREADALSEVLRP